MALVVQVVKLVIVIVFFCIALSLSLAVSVERKKRGDICQKVTCPVKRPVCSASLEVSDVELACQSCRGVLGNLFANKRCILHYISSNVVELFGNPPVYT